ncbi:hypothetical protein WS67_16520 [Burkholderia singularis]|uniref:Protein kinase domain-containing protein n=1 Tax=Burkholderia singularis TaxID=1503053 RepID=A0A118DN65_9BURK|nr:lipopolysaccharide kinase InaA family protein [Burkholderia singularis]KVE25986.1 hypothetical protein WS67_16520 [Burkholderia singularis]
MGKNLNLLALEQARRAGGSYEERVAKQQMAAKSLPASPSMAQAPVVHDDLLQLTGHRRQRLFPKPEFSFRPTKVTTHPLAVGLNAFLFLSQMRIEGVDADQNLGNDEHRGEDDGPFPLSSRAGHARGDRVPDRGPMFSAHMLPRRIMPRAADVRGNPINPVRQTTKVTQTAEPRLEHYIDKPLHIPDIIPSRRNVAEDILKKHHRDPEAMGSRKIANFIPEAWVSQGICRDGRSHCTYSKKYVDLYLEEYGRTVSPSGDIVGPTLTKQFGLPDLNDEFDAKFQEAMSILAHTLTDIVDTALSNYGVEPESGRAQAYEVIRHALKPRVTLLSPLNHGSQGYILATGKGNFYISFSNKELAVEKIPLGGNLEDGGDASRWNAWISKHKHLFFSDDVRIGDGSMFRAHALERASAPGAAVTEIVNKYLLDHWRGIYDEKYGETELENNSMEGRKLLPFVGDIYGLADAVVKENVNEAVFHVVGGVVDNIGPLKSVGKKLFKLTPSLAKKVWITHFRKGRVFRGHVEKIDGASLAKAGVHGVSQLVRQGDGMSWKPSIRKRGNVYCVTRARQRVKRGGDCSRVLPRARRTHRHRQEAAPSHAAEPAYRDESNLLGSGTAGKVYQLDDAHVIKEYKRPLRGGNDAIVLRNAETSKEAFNRLYGENAASVILQATDDPAVKIVTLKMKKIPGESLASILRRNDWALAEQICEEASNRDVVSELIDQLKSHGISHWDINLANILYDHNTKKFNLIDFDSASLRPPGMPLTEGETMNMRSKLRFDLDDFRRLSHIE